MLPIRGDWFQATATDVNNWLSYLAVAGLLLLRFWNSYSTDSSWICSCGSVGAGSSSSDGQGISTRMPNLPGIALALHRLLQLPTCQYSFVSAVVMRDYLRLHDRHAHPSHFAPDRPGLRRRLFCWPPGSNFDLISHVLLKPEGKDMNFLKVDHLRQRQQRRLKYCRQR